MKPTDVCCFSLVSGSDRVRGVVDENGNEYSRQF